MPTNQEIARTCQHLGAGQHGKAERFAAVVVGLRDGARHGAHAQDVALAFGHRNRLAGVEEIEGVRSLHHLFVCRQRELGLDETCELGFVLVEAPQQYRGVGKFEVVLRLLDFVLVIHIAVGHLAQRTIGPHDVEDALHALQVHGQAFKA